MKAHSSTTDRTYDSWDDLVAAEANGYVVVVLLRESHTQLKRIYARVVGPYTDQKRARNKASTLRKKYRRHAKVETHLPELLGVYVEPAWKVL